MASSSDKATYADTTLQEDRVLRVAFIHAPDPVYADTQNYGAKFMPVWAYTLASHIDNTDQFDLSLYDCRFQRESSITEADVYLLLPAT